MTYAQPVELYWGIKMAEVNFWIPGEPCAKERSRKGKNGHFYTPKKTRDYEKKVKALALAHPRAGEELVNICLHVVIGGRDKDVDNCAKSVLDALNGILYDDDKQVVGLHVIKYFDKERPGVSVYIYWGEDEEDF